MDHYLGFTLFCAMVVGSHQALFSTYTLIETDAVIHGGYVFVLVATSIVTLSTLLSLLAHGLCGIRRYIVKLYRNRL